MRFLTGPVRKESGNAPTQEVVAEGDRFGSPKHMKELEFVKYLARKFKPKRPVIKGIGDDCAVIDYAKDTYLLLTCDMVTRGTHFSKNTSPRRIGHKAMAVNISDIAAMGGIPKYALVSAGIPRGKGARFLREITRGIAEISQRFGISVIGGDTNRSFATVLSVTLIGEVKKRQLITRSGARPGDLVFVTGVLGEGKIRHLNFLPRLKEARILAENFKISSMIDLSDGLAMDLNRIASSSGVGFYIYKSLIPLSEKSVTLEKAISSGEDFELLFTATVKESRKIIKRMGKKNDLPVSLIGEAVGRRFGVKLVGEEGRITRLGPKGFTHL